MIFFRCGYSMLHRNLKQTNLHNLASKLVQNQTRSFIPSICISSSVKESYLSALLRQHTTLSIKSIGDYANLPLLTQVRHINYYKIDGIDPAKERRNLFFKVHYPEDGKYTIKKLKMTKLGGRDPDTGRKVFGGIGGGHKRRYRWIAHHRVPNGTLESEEPITIEERILDIQYDPNRTARIALVGRGEDLRYLIATTSMKKGDIIKSTNHIPRIPIIPNEGDCHPIAALPLGTKVCIIETTPGCGHHALVAAGTHATLVKKTDTKFIIKLMKPKKKKHKPKREIALDPRCMVVVGQVSNPDHHKVHIGSPNRMRWLGRRPNSGLKQKKTGKHGRKFRKQGPPLEFKKKKDPPESIVFTCPTEGHHKLKTPCVKRVT